MWTASYARRCGVARKILHALETIARESGITTLHLETYRTLIEAQALYRKEGYLEVDAFNDEPYASLVREIFAVRPRRMIRCTCDIRAAAQTVETGFGNMKKPARGGRTR